MTIKILLLGDVIGKPGRRILEQQLPLLQDHLKLDFVVANGENLAGGFGITLELTHFLLDLGVDVITSGNHIWDQRETLDYIDSQPRLLRPLNYPDNHPGKGWVVVETAAGISIGVINLIGTVFMQPGTACPFRAVDRFLKQEENRLPQILLVDVHAEASSEKVAMGWHLDGRVSAVFGTHTHVPAADHRILPGGSAFVSDIGMTGCYDSVIGMNTEKALNRFILKLPERLEVAKGPATLWGLVVEVDEASGRATAVTRITLRDGESLDHLGQLV
tara:strand:+ start:3518 stop:4342 length:825 start_codon:yes stop_codon:yes gene_type:complete